MGKLLKSLLIIILTLVIIAALAVGGIWAFCYFKYDVNVFSVASSLSKISSVPKIEDVAPNQPEEQTYQDVITKINNSFSCGEQKIITYNDETKIYSIDVGNAQSPLTENLNLNGKETCAFFNMILSNGLQTISAGSQTIKLSDYDFKLLEIDFGDVEEITKDETTTIKNSFKVVSSISLVSVKSKMGAFPLSILKSKVPDTLYISSDVNVLMEKNTISYNVESTALNLNKAGHKDLKPVFQLLNQFIKVGQADDLNKQIGELFVNHLLGNSESVGTSFCYTLVHTSMAQSFCFEKLGEQVVLSLKA